MQKSTYFARKIKISIINKKNIIKNQKIVKLKKEKINFPKVYEKIKFLQ